MHFICIIFCRLNPLSLVDICTPVVNRFDDAEEALQFLEKIGDKVKANTEAFVMTRVLIGRLHLTQFKNVVKTKAIVEEIEGLLNDVEGVGRVHAAYYLLATEHYKLEGDHANYYRYFLVKFMAYTHIVITSHIFEKKCNVEKQPCFRLNAKIQSN